MRRVIVPSDLYLLQWLAEPRQFAFPMWANLVAPGFA